MKKKEEKIYMPEKYPHERRGGVRPNSGRQPGTTYVKRNAKNRKSHEIRTTEEEFLKISESAKRVGKSLSDFIRDRALMD